MSELPELNTITSQPGLGKFNGFMTLRSYIDGYKPSQQDVKVLSAFNGKAPDEKSATHAFRWFSHISSFTAEERKQWPEHTSTEAPAASKKDDDDAFQDDDEDDLFAEDADPEAAAQLQAKLKKEAEERAKKKMKEGRSMIVLEVKPYEAEFDLESLAQKIKKIEHEGIQNWGLQHKLEPVAFGIKKLVISAVVFDELIGVDDLSDLIMEENEEDVQSIDVQAMSKV